MTGPRIIFGILVALGIGSAYSAAWLVWHAPHCKMAPARGYYATQDRCR